MASKDIVTSLYNGKHEVRFTNSSHRYKVDGMAAPGVTTSIGKVLAKPGLMLWPMNEALKYLREKLPVVTEADLDEAAKAHVKRRDKGADTGSIVHELVEKVLLGETVNLEGQPEEVVLAVNAFKEWQSGSKPEVVAVEQVVFSESMWYAGTFDSILKVNGKVYLCDLKTTNASREAPDGVYNEYFVQLGAYLCAYDEQRQYELENGGTELVEIDDVMIISCKKNGIVDIKTGSDVGASPEDCKNLWRSVWHLAGTLANIKGLLGGK